MTGPIAPVLQRIAEIQSRFGGAPAGAALGTSASSDFAAALGTAETELESTDAAGTGDTTTTAVPWTGIGSTSWVYPNGTSGSPSSTVPSASGTGPSGATSWGPSASTGASSSTAPVADVATVPSTATPVAAFDAVPAGTPFAAEFQAAADRYGVPAKLLAAVGWVESRYQPDVVSAAGAQGLMQLMPGTAEHYGVDPWDPAQAIDAGAHVLADHFARFGDWNLALAAYNAGGGSVAAAGNMPPSAAVAGYVDAVNQRIEQM